MTYVVTETCIKCKYTDCVDVCPVDCFREGPNMLVIDPDECIDCTLCVAECPVEAIFAEDDVPDSQRKWTAAERRARQGVEADHREETGPCGRGRVGEGEREGASAREVIGGTVDVRVRRAPGSHPRKLGPLLRPSRAMPPNGQVKERNLLDDVAFARTLRVRREARSVAHARSCAPGLTRVPCAPHEFLARRGAALSSSASGRGFPTSRMPSCWFRTCTPRRTSRARCARAAGVPGAAAAAHHDARAVGGGRPARASPSPRARRARRSCTRSWRSADGSRPPTCGP